MALWFKGINPVVDLVVVRSHPENGLEILLVKRSDSAEAEPGKWALPGGFQNTDAAKDTECNSGTFLEEPLTAAIRECKEETTLDVEQLGTHVKPVGIYRGPGRDPRETEERFTESHAYFLSLDGILPINKSNHIFGMDDVSESAWTKWEQLKKLDIAFDHLSIIADAEKYLAHSWHTHKKPKP